MLPGLSFPFRNKRCSGAGQSSRSIPLCDGTVRTLGEPPMHTLETDLNSKPESEDGGSGSCAPLSHAVKRRENECAENGFFLELALQVDGNLGTLFRIMVHVFILGAGVELGLPVGGFYMRLAM
ncbi:hypothetical protein AVEN_4636-1 [Araneus ventricosus]|uniref:Uncharacterized protein n=1 Tax=Araneus ventricosus TaxID=182803 RepID=A0A4Y2LJF9_ARAVE|nr:hypothetical protein AVEN_4636-1 [Araneus ventricosus]